ncbi:hypothetical protein HK097_010623 [Rhizophlyctis rosea]|uniref:Ankyrin n=1 Tax=Rhizophlyctis rosea TaxID=64517 RepID=A0AAD5SF80_9FUNG|nr:hypothetical protein HK097_010623 [Rhizophlyctis rosea]
MDPIPDDLIPAIIRLSHPASARNFRSACRSLSYLVTPLDLLFGEAHWRLHTDSLLGVFSWTLDTLRKPLPYKPTVNHTDLFRPFYRKIFTYLFASFPGWGRNPLLSVAVERDLPAFVTLALDSGADIHYNGSYALRTAVANNNLHLVDLLIEAGATREDLKIVRVAIDNGNPDILRLLVKDGSKSTLGFYQAAYEGKYSLVEVFLDCGFGADWAFAGAVGGEHVEMIHKLVKKGLDASLGLGEAAIRGKADIVRLLFDLGATIENAPSRHMMLRESLRHTEVVRLLIDAGAIEYDGAGPEWDLLTEAAMKALPEAASLLLDSGKEWDLRRAFVESRSDAVLEVLLEKVPDAREYVDDTLIHAASLGSVSWVKILLNAGADPRAKENQALKMLQQVQPWRWDDSKEVEGLLLAAGADRTVSEP